LLLPFPHRWEEQEKSNRFIKGQKAMIQLSHTSKVEGELRRLKSADEKV
jgi:hypothetical protein